MVERIIGIIGGIFGLIGTVLAAFIYLNATHFSKTEAALQAEHFERRIHIAESERYGQIAKYYYELRLERPLSAAEEARLAIVEANQQRIAEELRD
jgi:hypothetical protein